MKLSPDRVWLPSPPAVAPEAGADFFAGGLGYSPEILEQLFPTDPFEHLDIAAVAKGHRLGKEGQ